MNEEQAKKLAHVLTPRWSRYWPHTPTAPQAAFLLLDCKEAFYGGAAGGGKSDALLMGALQYVDVPGYHALLLRRTYADLSLPSAIMNRADEWLRPTDAKWHEDEKTWVFPSGATMTFGYLASEKDKYRYQSAEFQYVGFDELTQFQESMYRYLFSRLRRLAGSEVPIRMRSASNPGGIGHDWVDNRFVKNRRKGRVFIPARIVDNPHIDQKAYIESLRELDPVERAQLLAGDWTAKPRGNIFKRHWFELVELFMVPKDVVQVRYWDMASTEVSEESPDPDFTCGCLLAIDPVLKDFYVMDVRKTRASPGQVELFIRNAAYQDGITTEIWMEEEPGSSGKTVIDHYMRNVLMGYFFRGDRATGSKEIRAKPVAGYAEPLHGDRYGRIKIVRGPWNDDFFDELEGWGLKSQVHRDQVDSLSGGFNKLARAMGEVAYGPSLYT
jgi:predicted phage terminase large subunit-like protein